MKNFFLAITIAFTFEANAQSVAINNGGSTADNSAILDLKSNNQGVLVPRMTAAQRGLIGTPATGLMVYQTDATAGFYFYNGTAWTSLNGAAGANGTNGSNGQGVPTGGTANQVLAKLNATDFNTAWVTPSAAFPNIELNIRNNASQPITSLAQGFSANLITFSGTSSNTTLTGGNTWNGNTFTIGSTGAGWYQINAQIVGTTADGVCSANAGIPFYMDLDNAVGSTMSSAILYRSNYTTHTNSQHLKI